MGPLIRHVGSHILSAPIMYTIRRARDSDRHSIEEIISLYPNKLIQEIPKTERFFVACNRKRIVGCCALDAYSKKISEIRSLAVLEEYRGKGVATKLIEECKKEAKRLKIRQVLAVTSEESLFRKMGFDTFHEEKTALFFTND